jgi:hypothetical protein
MQLLLADLSMAVEEKKKPEGKRSFGEEKVNIKHNLTAIIHI